jgi:hypothetical protein
VSARSLSWIFAALAMLASSWQLSAQRTATGSISGQVLTEGESTPLPARVWLVGAARPRVPNARGTFRFEGLVPGRYHLRATYLGFTPVDTTLSLAAGARLEVVIRLTANPVELSSMTIREVVKPPEPPRPKIRVPDCTRFLVMGPTTMVCVTPQMLAETTVIEHETFQGRNSIILEAAEKTVTDLGFVTERVLQLDDRTWLILAHDKRRTADTSLARLEVEETGANDTTVRVSFTTVSWKRREHINRARAFLTTMRRNLR